MPNKQVRVQPSVRFVAAALLTALAVALTWVATPTIAGSSVRAGHGVLHVATEPAVGSLISVDGVVRNTEAINGLEIPIGQHEICFSDVDGYLAPSCEVITITESETSTLTGEFTSAGTLSVQVSPDDLTPVVSVDGVARDRGSARLPLAVGTHQICAEEVAGYRTPACQRVDVVQGVDAAVELVYELIDGPRDGEPGPSQPVEDNLLSEAQRSMETSKTGWVPQGNSLVAGDGSTAADGDRALRVTADRSGPWPDDTGTVRVGTTPGRAAAPVTPGAAYEGAVQVLSTATQPPARCEIRFYDSSGSILETTEDALSPLREGRWIPLSCGGTAPEAARTASLRVFLSEMDYGQVVFLDDAWLTGPAGTPPSSPPVDEGDGSGSDPTPEPDPEPEPEAPSPDPTPTPSDPPTSGAPAGPDTTGVATESRLRPSGSIASERDGQVIENLEVTGRISVSHSNVTIRNVRVLGTGRYGIEVPHAQRDAVRNLVIEDTEIRGVSGERSAALVHYGQWTGRRLDISGYADGVKIGSNQTLEDSWIHDLHVSSGSHNDGIQAVSGRNIVIRGNTIEGQWQGQTSAILLQTNSGPIDQVTLENNRLSGGGYTLYITDKGNGHGPATNVTVRGNTWVQDSWSYGATRLHRGAGWTWSSNRTTSGSAVD